MKIKLNFIEIENFKGIKHFRLDLGGENALLAGKNGTGKTTVVDAWFWLMTDADSDQQTRFNALELNKEGIVIDHQDAMVSAEFFVGSTSRRIKKCYRQKWMKKRGHAIAELAGHTTEYYFDDVPVGRKKFNEKLNALVNLELFRILSDPLHFCSKIKPEIRRETLIDLIGIVDNHKILSSDPELHILTEMMHDRTPDEVKELLKSDRKKADDQLIRLPERIDELKKMMPNVEGENEVELKKSLKDIEFTIESEKNEIAAIQSGLSLETDNRRLSQLKIERDDLIDTHKREFKYLIDDENKAYGNLKVDKENLENFLKKLEGELKENLEKDAKLFESYKKIRSTFFKTQDICFACKQPLPADQIESQKKEFKLRKAETEKDIAQQGKELREERTKMLDDKEDYQKKLEKIKFVIENKLSHIRVLHLQSEDKIKDINAQFASQIEELESKIKSQTADIAPGIEVIEESLFELNKQKAQIESKLLDFVQTDKINRRIKERKNDLKNAAEAFEEAERKLYLLELFSRKKSEFIENNVNQFFEITQWKLFETQINGGIREICEPLFDGVPFDSDLNTGAKINIGLDVIRTLQRHYDIKLPVFIDNAESITNWMIDLDCQMIKLSTALNTEKLEVIIG
jgi:hypothetical protein